MMWVRRRALMWSALAFLTGCRLAPPTVEKKAEPSPSAPKTTLTEQVMDLNIAVDQVGYRPTDGKTVTVERGDGAARPGPEQFDVLDASGKSLLRGPLRGPTPEPESADHHAWVADLSALKSGGPFQVRIGGSLSPKFAVNNDVYADVYAKSVRAYFLNRCGVAVDDPVTGVKHAACHLDKAVLDTDHAVSLDVAGGWHDAGDYGRYMSTAAVTVGQMLLLAEHAPDVAKRALSGTDLLAEARYELDWMLKMQRDDGAVYHKVTTARFAGFIAPEEDTAQQFVYGIGTSSTGVFAAATARAARLFASDRPYAAKLRGAAERAWTWLAAHPNHIVPAVGKTGPYLTGSDRDARLWAAVELFALTGAATYHDAFASRLPATVSPPSWADVTDLGLLTYAFMPGARAEERQQAKDAIQSLAHERAGQASSHPFGVALNPDEYTWASAKTALAIAMHLLLADRLTPDRTFLPAAVDQLHWVLGRNPLGRSFVTGVGANPPLHPHHRLVAAEGKMIPGMLVGGPNQKAEDGIAPANLGPRSYVDEQPAYSVNEPAIDYNAPLVFVSGWLADQSGATH